MHLHMDTDPSRTSLINILIYHQACWYCHTLKIALSDRLTMKMVIGCGDLLLHNGVKRLLRKSLSGLHCYLVILSIRMKLQIQTVICRGVKIN